MPTSPRGLAGAKDAELAARRDREAGEGARGVGDDDLAGSAHSDDDEDDDDEVTTRVFEVELSSGSSPWATAFLECASEGDLETLTKLLDDGKVELNDVDVDGFTALMIAAAEAQHDVAMELLRRGADVSIRTHEMRSTALHFAAKSGAAQVVEAICQQDPDRIDAQNLDGDTPLVWACTEGRLDAVRVLLAHHANVNVVSHRAMSALICAVMLRESDGSDADDPNDLEEDVAATDADRAEIVRLLLTKNPKLVNYQDRDYSTAMHLAASHGYLQCVKALIEFGADITLRNAIGQTPLEEAEETGIKAKSGACVAYLRKVWKQLEEEASARMMAMLEMEELTGSASHANGPGGSRGAAKKANKKKQKKAKQRRVGKSNAVNSTTTDKVVEDKAVVSSGEGSSDEEEEPGEEKDDVGHVAAVKEHPGESVGTGDDEQARTDEQRTDALADGGVWTTVGRKHNQYLGQRAATTETADQVATFESASTAQEKIFAATATRKVCPANPRTKQSQSVVSSGRVGLTSTPTLVARSNEKPATKKNVPVSSKYNAGSADSTRVASAIATSSAVYPPLTPGSSHALDPSSLTDAVPVKSPFSTFQRLHSNSRLYERYERRPEAAIEAREYSSFSGVGSSYSSSMWRASVANRSLHTPFSLGSSFSSQSLPTLASQSEVSTSSSAAIWRYASPAGSQSYDRGSAFSSKKLAPIDSIDSMSQQHSPPDSIVRSLSCGLCGELVNDNLQCSGTLPVFPNVEAASKGAGAATPKPAQCVQLYCATCLTRAVGNEESAGSPCIKCGLPLCPHDMKRNDFAQAQVAVIARTSRSNGSRHVEQQHLQDLYEHMRSLMHKRNDRIQATGVDPFFLVPGANLAPMSVGQLDALEELHLAALQQITQARIENARVLERLRMEERIKTERAVMQFASQASSS